MPISDEQVTVLLRELVWSSYTSARPKGMRGVRGDDLLTLAQARLGDTITGDELDEAVARIGGERVGLTNMRDVIASLFGRGKRWRRAYLIPTHVFEGLNLPTPLLPPRAGPAD